MNIANFGFSGGDGTPRPGTGTVPASSGSMFGDMLPFRLHLASSTARTAGVEGVADAVAAAGAAFPGLDGIEFSSMPRSISIATPEGVLAGPASEDGANSEELAPTLALLAPIVDTPLPTNVIAISGGGNSARAASSASTGSKAEDAGNGGLMAQIAATTDAGEELLSDPDGDVAAMLRRVSTSATDRTGTTRKTEPGSTDMAQHLDQARGRGTEARATAPDLARFQAASIAVANAAARSNDDTASQIDESAPEQRKVAVSISDLVLGDSRRRAAGAAAAPVRGASAPKHVGARVEVADADREFDLSAVEPGTFEDTPLQRQVAASVADIRGGPPATFAAQFVTTTNADQAPVETGARSEATQTIPLDQRFSDRLGAMVGAAMSNATLKDGTLRLQVTPDHLGPIEIEMDTSGSSERLQITVESEAVRQAVAQAQGRIEQELRQAGARLAGLDVALRDSGADTQGGAQTNSQADTDGRRPGPATTHDTASPATGAADLRPAAQGRDAGNVLYA